MIESEHSRFPDDPLAIAYEVLKGDDPLVRSAKQHIWRRLWVRDTIDAWINRSGEVPAFNTSLHHALPTDDLELLEDIKLFAETFGDASSPAFTIVELANERIKRYQGADTEGVTREQTGAPGGNSPPSGESDAKSRGPAACIGPIDPGRARHQSISVPPSVLYPRVFDSTPLAVIKVDTQGTCEYANRRFASIAGAGNFEGHNVRELFLDDQSRSIIEEEFEKRFTERRTGDYEVVLTRLDNKRRIHVRVASTPILDSAGRPVGAIAIFRELTFERVIKRITYAIATSQTSGDLLRAVANEVRKLIPFDQLNVSIYGSDKRYVRALFADPSWDAKLKIRWYKMSPAMAKFAAQQDVIRVGDMETYYSQPGFIDSNQENLKSQGWHDRPRSLLRCPVLRKGRVAASLSIGRRKANSFTDPEYELFSSLPLREAVTMALYLEDRQNLKFRLDLMGSIFKDWNNQEKVASVIVQQLLEHHDWDHAAFFMSMKKGRKSGCSAKKPKTTIGNSCLSQTTNKGWTPGCSVPCTRAKNR
jgi:PAS domain S-box-containing protein